MCLQLVAQVVVEVMCCADIVRKEGHSHLAAGRAVSRLATLITLFGLVVVVCVCKVRYKQATTRRVTRRVDVQREREFYLYGSTPSVDVSSSTQTAPQATAQWKKWLPALLRGLVCAFYLLLVVGAWCHRMPSVRHLMTSRRT